MDKGFVEAKLRGYRSTFLREDHYTQIKNFNNLEEVFQYLQSETDYGEYIDTNIISIVSLKNAMKKELKKLFLELIKPQEWVSTTKTRVIVIRSASWRSF